MNKTLFAFALLGLTSSVALAQEPTTPPPAEAPAATPAAPAAAPAAAGAPQMAIGADAELAIPLGNFSDGAGLGFGLLLKFQYSLNPSLALTARAGYVHYLEKNGLTAGSIPVLVGAKYFFMPGVYGAAEVGISNNRASATILGQSVSSSETDFAFGVGAGYEMANIGPGTLDLRAEFQMLNPGGDGSNGSQIAISVGYNYGL